MVQNKQGKTFTRIYYVKGNEVKDKLGSYYKADPKELRLKNKNNGKIHSLNTILNRLKQKKYKGDVLGYVKSHYTKVEPKSSKEKDNGTLQAYAKQFKISSEKSNKIVENSGKKEYNKNEDRIKSQFPSGKSKTYHHDDGISASYPIESVKISQEILKKAKKVEVISTTLLKDISSQVGAKLEGLEYRFKSEESMARKITEYIENSGCTLEEARKEIRDAVRYTMVSDEKKLYTKLFLN